MVLVCPGRGAARIYKAGMFRLGLAALLPVLCFASTALALVIEPLRPTLAIPPGESGTIEILLTNEQTTPRTIEISFQDLSREKERFPRWLELDSTVLRLAPSETKTLFCAVSVPAEARGELHGRLAFTSRSSDASGAGPVSINTRISIPLSVPIKGTERYAAEIECIRMNLENPRRVEVVLANKGNVHLRPRGQCVIMRPGGRAAGKFRVNTDGYPVYPGERKSLSGWLMQELDPGNYTVHARFTLVDDRSIVKSLALYVPEPESSPLTPDTSSGVGPCK